jgi:polyisoprenoid-binding protein YceI
MRKFIWNISERNSILHFKAKYLTIGHLSGSFKKLRGTVVAGALFEDPEIELFIGVSSVETLDTDLNRKIKSAAILDAVGYPDLMFASAGGCRASSGVIWELEGTFTVKQYSSTVNMIVNFSDLKVKGKRTEALFHLFGTVDLVKSGLGELRDKGVAEIISVNAEIYLLKADECLQNNST